MVAVGLALQLDAMCRKIERIFPDTICAWGGFSQPREPTEDEDIVVEVFFAPGGSSRSITRATHEDARRLWRQHEVSVAVVAHYVEDTLRYYVDDVLAVLSSRGVADMLDPGGFCGRTARAGLPWAGAACSSSIVAGERSGRGAEANYARAEHVSCAIR